MESIQKWIDSDKDYDTGVKLYEGLSCCNRMLLRKFKQRETPFNREKLLYELEKYITTSRVVPAVEVIEDVAISSDITIASQKKKLRRIFMNCQKSCALYYRKLTTYLSKIVCLKQN